jgi:hypothetical protein
MPPRQPQDKALVVNAAKIIHRRLRRALRDRPPMTQINGVLDGILAIVNGFILRRFPGECRDSRFASIDKPMLQPLTVSPFVCCDTMKSCKAPRDYHIACDNVAYSVQIIDNPLLADAIMDRFVQRSHKIPLKGEIDAQVSRRAVPCLRCHRPPGQLWGRH